ncbi:putative sulfate transporter [Symmachiella macrocystis]|uniref:Putative sulfate transporter n=1 Tax=Symmachiella macrocystis TaxID=2527985 RepID=A0A5C6BB68_9PLAN|nr:SulP family inorganic anion transporter [Symmachiella macrocystis]TWU08967.1 putative sulfate transporter [Symmachiella macrocystis]
MSKLALRTFNKRPEYNHATNALYLVFHALFSTFLHEIPLAALAGMLVYTGYRLAHLTEFIHVYRIGKEQLAIFLTTLVVVLATDLLIGVAAGIILKMVIHVANGVPIKSLFKPYIEVQEIDDNKSLILARESAVFSNWIPFPHQIEQIGLVQKRNLIVDVSCTKLVDHSVMEKLDEMQRDFEQEGLTFEVRGLVALQPLAKNTHAARKRGLATMRRLTIVAAADIEQWLEQKLLNWEHQAIRRNHAQVLVATTLRQEEPLRPQKYASK